MPSEYIALWKTLEDSVHRSQGQLTPEQRASSHSEAAAPEHAKLLVQRLQGRAADIDDADVLTLVNAGWNDDQIFEFLISGSVFAGAERLRVGLAALYREGA